MSLDYLYIGLLKTSELGIVEIPQEEINYRRIEMGPTDWVLVDNNTITNVYDVKFNEASSEWGAISHFGVFDSLQGGNILAVGILNLESVTHIHKGIQIQFKTGKLSVDISALEQEIENG